MKPLFKLYKNVIKLSNMTLSPLLDLAIRLYMANIFFKAGKLKYETYVNEGWESVVYQFEEYHPVPGIDPNLAAIGGTAGELILPVLLAFGLFTRFGAAGLLIMTMVIQFAVPEDYGVSNPEHYLWMLLLAIPLLKGGGMLSIDGIAQKFLCKNKCDSNAEAKSEETGELTNESEKEA